MKAWQFIDTLTIKHMRRRDLTIQKYMSEIAGDAFFWVYF